MSILSKRIPFHLQTILNHPTVARVGSWRPVRFVINVLDDYLSVSKDAYQEARKRPWRTGVICSGLALAYIAYRQTPTEVNFTDIVLENNNDFIQVPVRTRNSTSEVYLVDVQRLWSQDRLEYVNWGIFALILRRDFNKTCDLYEARCKYMTTPVSKWFTKVVDVGVFDRWMFMQKAMKDFDVNALD